MPITNTMNPSALSSSSSSSSSSRGGNSGSGGSNGSGSGGTGPKQHHNVLLLGVSFPDIPGTLADGKYKAHLLTHKEPTAEQSVELVRRGILTEMDARDHARAVETERAYDGEDLRVYTVSREVGGIYRKDRHIYANFNNSRTLCQQLGRQFGWRTQFQQVILDYYWMPTGWLVTRWAKSLFQNTLPDLVRHRLLAFPRNHRGGGTCNDDGNHDGNNDDVDNQNVEEEEQENTPEMEAGVVFLPFCAHVCKELVGAIKILREYYAISFVKKNELGGNALWKGTMRIDGKLMQHRLGKRLDQEEIYCTFNPTDIYKSMEDSHVVKDDVMTMLLSIEDFDEIRMIRLKPLRQHEPPSPFRIEPVVPEKGGFMGLNWAMGKKRFKELKKPGRKKVVAAVAVSEEEDESTTEEEEDDSSSCYSSCDENGLLGFGFDDYDENEEAFDPEDPDRIPDVLHYFPYPALDLKSYTIPKELTDVDYVLDDWAVTWGPKAGRKSKKLDLARDSYREYRRQRTETLSMNERKPPVPPLASREEGYKWTWVEGYGWKLSLVGDAPDSNLEEKIVDRATRDHDMSMTRALFQMKNPDYKIWSRTWMMGRKHMTCYRIPRRSVLLKTHGSREDDENIQYNEAGKPAEEAATQSDEQKNLSKEAAESLMELATYLDNAKGVLSIDRLTESDVLNMSGPEMRLYLETYGEPNIPKFKAQRRERLLEHIKGFKARKKSDGPSAADRVAALSSLFASDSSDSETEETSQTPILLLKFADYVAHLPELEGVSTDVLRVVPGENYVQELPPFKSKSIAKHVRCNLSDHEGFPFELYKLLQRYRGLFAHVISWQDKGKSFKIHDEAGFEQSVLSQCSSDDDFQSFKQTLRRFGFQKITAGARVGGYHHDLFRRGEAKQVSHILRRFNLPELASDFESVSAIDPTEGPCDDAKSVTESASAVDTGSSSDESSGGESYQPEAPRKPKMTRKIPKRPAGGLAREGIYDLTNGTTFLSELHRLLENATADKLSHIVSWDAHGNAFIVHDKDIFLKMVLAPFSSMSSFLAFQTKMRRFGFRVNGAVFQHFNFTRGVLPGMNSKSVESVTPGVSTSSRSDARGKQKSKLRGGKAQRSKSQPTRSIISSESSANVTSGPVDGFIEKLYNLLGNAKKEKIEHILSWSSNGKSVIVHDCEAFDEVVAPKYLPTKSFSFRKRLYFFGFVKKGTPYRGVVTFTSPFFVRGKKDNLKFLHNSRNKRKHTASPPPLTSEGVNDRARKKHKSNSVPLREENRSKPRGRSTLTSAIAAAPIKSSCSTSHSSAPKEKLAKPRGRMTLTSALASEDWTVVEKLSQSDTSPQPDEKTANNFNRSATSEELPSAAKTLPGFLYRDYANEDPASLPELVKKARKKAALPVFPSNLYQLLEHASANGNEDICSFAEHGRCFFVHDEAKFIDMANKLGLAKLGSFAPFLNQLKRYGFHQLQRGKDSGGFFHEFFLRGRPLHAKRLRPFSRINGGDPMPPLALPEALEPDFWAMPFVKNLSSSCSQPRIDAEMDAKSLLEESAVSELGAGSTLTDRRVSQKPDSALASPSVVSEESETAVSLLADVASPAIDASRTTMTDQESVLRTCGVSSSKRKRSTMHSTKPNKGVVSSSKKVRSGQCDVALETDERSITPAPQRMTPSHSSPLRLGVSDVLGMQHSTPTRTGRRFQDTATPPAGVQNHLVQSIHDSEEERQALHSAFSDSAAFQEGNMLAQNGLFLAKLGLSRNLLLRTLGGSVSKGEQRARTFLDACVWHAGLRRQDSAIFSFLERLFQSSDGTAIERLKVIEKWATLLKQCYAMFAAKGSLTPLQSMTDSEMASLLRYSVQQMRERPDEIMGMTLLRMEELSELNQFLDDFLASPLCRTAQMGNATIAVNDTTRGALQMSTTVQGDGVSISASMDSHSANSSSTLPSASSGVLRQLLGQIVPNAFECANAMEEGGETLPSLFRPR